MIAILLRLILGIITTIINFFITPIMTFISTLYTNSGLSSVLVTATSFFDTIKTYIKFAISYTGFYPTTITVICLLLAGIITVPIVVSGYKIVCKWISILP